MGYTNYKDRVPSEVYKEVLDIYLPLVTCLFSNNRKLRRARGVSLKAQANWFRERGILVSFETISRAETFRFHNFNILYLSFFSYYWTIPLSTLLTVDLSEYPSILLPSGYTVLSTEEVD